MHSIQQLQLCSGVPADVCNLVTVTPSSNQFRNIVHHTVPHNLKSYEDGGPSIQTTVFLRSHNCEVLCECSECAFCEGAEKSLLKNTKAAKGKEPTQPAGSKAPLILTSKERLVATVQQQREIVKELEGRISDL